MDIFHILCTWLLGLASAGGIMIAVVAVVVVVALLFCTEAGAATGAMLVGICAVCFILYALTAGAYHVGDALLNHQSIFQAMGLVN